VTPVLRGLFVRVDQLWSREGQGQEGSLLVGCDPKSATASAYWIDTFHTGRTAMSCAGSVRDDGVIDVRGAYAAPPGPDWGWRIVITPLPPGRLEVVMFNIDPAGQEYLAVQSGHERAERRQRQRTHGASSPGGGGERARADLKGTQVSRKPFSSHRPWAVAKAPAEIVKPVGDYSRGRPSIQL